MGHPVYQGIRFSAVIWVVSRRVRRTRRRAVSRPVGSYHSWRVWMPPPVPPVPRARAGMSLERGMLASVEPRRSSVRMTRWRSTARRVWRRGESSGRAAAGRFPMVWMWSFGGPVVVLCVVKVDRISSRIWWIVVAVAVSWVESVERRSRRAVADSGMELMEVPPEMWPTLMVVRGLVGSLRLAIWVRARLRMRMGLGVPASFQEWPPGPVMVTRKRRSEEHTSELQSHHDLVCR